MRLRVFPGVLTLNEDTNYFRRRAVSERAMASAADRQDVREIHEELARQYEALVAQPTLRPSSADPALAVAAA
jgi:hypothetical protein